MFLSSLSSELGCRVWCGSRVSFSVPVQLFKFLFLLFKKKKKISGAFLRVRGGGAGEGRGAGDGGRDSGCVRGCQRLKGLWVGEVMVGIEDVPLYPCALPNHQHPSQVISSSPLCPFVSVSISLSFSGVLASLFICLSLALFSRVSCGRAPPL